MKYVRRAFLLRLIVYYDCWRVRRTSTNRIYLVYEPNSSYYFYFRFSKVQMLPHTGFVYYSQIVQDTNPVNIIKIFKVYDTFKFQNYFQDLRRKAARLVAGKCALAARVDACHENVHGEIGLRFKEDIEKKLDKLQEPPPVKFAKPLPKPIEGSKKKRGGKRVRKMKERYALTEFRKQANRLNFGDVCLLDDIN